MNEARREVELYKEFLGCHPSEKINLGTDDFLPKNARMLSYLEQQKAYAIALDQAVARKLNVELNDFEEFYRDKSVEEAEEWAKGFPDNPSCSYLASSRY
jgi:hypothetical protein